MTQPLAGTRHWYNVSVKWRLAQMNAISQISSDITAAVAMDLAMELHNRSTVWNRHGIDPLHGEAMLLDPFFKKMVESAKKEWQAVTNTKQRIRLKAQLAVEDSIADLYKLACDINSPGAARVSAFKELVNLSGTAVQQEGGGGVAGPSVNIYLNGDSAPAVTIAAGKSNGHLMENEDADLIDVTPSNVADGPAWGE